MRKLIALITIALTALAFARPAAGACTLCVASVTVHTRDGAEWQPGEPVMLVFEVSRASAARAFPGEATAVVMELDRERIKCLEVELRKVSEGTDRARYAGLFYPFRPGDFDGTLGFAGEVQEFSFRVEGPEPARDASLLIGTSASATAVAAGPLLLALVPIGGLILLSRRARRGKGFGRLLLGVRRWRRATHLGRADSNS